MIDHADLAGEPEDLHARRASSFGASAAAYARHRPDYPAAAIEWALAPAGAGSLRVLDLGAGTGKLTAGIRALGHRVIAIEPDAAMLAQLGVAVPGVPSVRGVAEAIGLRDGSVDAVLVGQALHWFDQSRALPEITRVLCPGGVLGGFWNSDDDRTEWLVRLAELSRAGVEITMPPSSQRLPEHPLLGSGETVEFPHSQRRNAQSLIATMSTHSHMLVLPPATRAAAIRRMNDYLNSRPETSSGEFDVPLHTLAYRAVRRG
ncbi:MAG: class I SAM-dependent methyltransferase [Sciscionella sp.]|nr:class I SAM-dependent methyltransferase [Sciscionella sp.]